MRFSKMHGAGNDFVVLDLRGGAPVPTPALCARLADRHFGVGCDQILTVEHARSTEAVASYRIWNADGSSSGQCGNGARCIAAWLVRDGSAPAQGDFVIESPAGRHAVTRDAAGQFVIDMGPPRFDPRQVPLLGFDTEQDSYALTLRLQPSACAQDDRIEVRFGAVSMGNPHALLEVENVDTADVARLGPLLQRSAAFPESCNVGFAQVLSNERIRLRVFERGTGETLACGSGACAAVAVLARRGRVDAASGVAVELPGGSLRIRQDGDSGTFLMGGPAAFVFEGEWL